MKFVISREALLRPLQLVAGVVEKRQTLPVLSNVLLEVRGQQLSLTGTDLEVELVGRVTLDEAGVEGAVTVPGKKLMDICRSLQDGAQIEIALDDQRVNIRSGRSRFTLSSLPASEFPNVESVGEEKSFTMSQQVLRRALDRTSFAMAQQDVRYYLNGMLFEVSTDSLRTVATDGHRLATCRVDISGPDEASQIILPRKGVLELAKLLTDAEMSVTLSLSGNHLRTQTENFTFISKLVDGKFPDYTRVIPKNGTNVMLADRQELRQVFARTAILSNEKYRGVRLVLAPDLLQVFANNPEQEEAEESVAVHYSGDSLEMGFNVAYLLDVMSVISNENVKLTLSDANSSALLEEPEGGDSLYVVMPMRL
ncbi:MULTISPECIES: DNA polymerase III subunit beta [unclassified Oceanobacter]|jgi:DNA polymerase-3 subunit beta|uniref:DNA polymerase III subunit beta n=1 Tax=unclassified Oceanobacter TaxID=2620260 RepID=UPI0026E2B6C0|nr:MULTISPECIES: DNA polymerase III subunit beta [unclassified Oceanobacter]MDO6680848.1 DNA polymerase III subunit beta [Oceanobacter sp. 5_MG-2023]MDP2504617.1 DNA polymerase III subunit beta [Oceanobacter sp. 3_MG-2023]MDP2546930.1 DNA polymerase III subunit beta [Oceanobacter sp. 4_MG-2023]MDP2607752.1 DNA polymerase III subunit beta [Oceanobacter sp. 1_MG-2023]MDP2611064.1 DNA polymerase III subunit beta [Oceanobacter sp. 2_MG-2023]